MNRKDFVTQLVPHCTGTPGQHGEAWAPVNIALAKYWGKRNAELNLPQNSSLSISLPELGTHTRLTLTEGADTVTLNGALAPEAFAQRLSRFLNLFRPDGLGFAVETTNTVPTAAGLASSASGFAALIKALDALFDWQLDYKTLSMLARIGSGSASRSLYDGFAVWHRGEKDDGTDSYAEGLPETWPDLRIGLVEVDTSQKPIGSTAGMQQTVNSCPLYTAWPTFAEQSVQTQLAAIRDHDMEKLGDSAEHNALTMHATMIATRPTILYWTPETVQAIHTVQQLRASGTPVWFTMDAGPNLKLLLPHTAAAAVQTSFPEVRILAPFATA
ncbi:diphosphomevalonate decarboxylase [Sulfurivirga caldicuralii]|uniref:diphosphomevalonate decarboxylase n=1 Tax=Sulfurivirga caldicuralii TaxID=364032 RepID=A0A1N6GA10_9GAMM|nr:diphosphomevalonate decarboxylase [Sulfurivirga caldicuralii]SIO04396.1 diphosphomevalonate decarboxylase [Sulfurivirga caldicuralii]